MGTRAVPSANGTELVALGETRYNARREEND
jgi:hypothetical protein